jgi:hypothetical protein
MSRSLDNGMRIGLFFAVFPALLALAAPALARGTLDSILPGIRAQHPGRLSDAEPWTDQDGNTHYRIKWMTPEGRILYFDADARTGRYSNAGGGGHGRDGDGGRGGRDDGASDDSASHRNHWNDDGENGGGDWRRSGGEGRHGPGGGDWGGGNWHGRDGGAFGGRGGWHGGNNGGGGHRHHGG